MPLKTIEALRDGAGIPKASLKRSLGTFDLTMFGIGAILGAGILTGALVALPAALLNIDEAMELTNIGTIFAFSIVCAAVMILRLRRPDLQRRFRMPWVWVLAPTGIRSCAWVACGLPPLTWLRFFVWLALGLGIYHLYGRTNSRLRTPGAAMTR